MRWLLKIGSSIFSKIAKLRIFCSNICIVALMAKRPRKPFFDLVRWHGIEARPAAATATGE
jgi:hypothetical protein